NCGPFARATEAEEHDARIAQPAVQLRAGRTRVWLRQRCIRRQTEIAQKSYFVVVALQVAGRDLLGNDVEQPLRGEVRNDRTDCIPGRFEQIEQLVESRSPTELIEQPRKETGHVVRYGHAQRLHERDEAAIVR